MQEKKSSLLFHTPVIVNIITDDLLVTCCTDVPTKNAKSLGVGGLGDNSKSDYT